MACRTVLWAVWVVTLITQIGCGREDPPAMSAAPPTPVSQRVITIGKVSDKPADIIDEYQPLADYLASSLSEFDIGWVQAADELETMAQWLTSGKVDLYFDNLYAGLVVADLSGCRPVVLRVKEGAPAKHGVFFTLADSGITALDDLKGHMIAMEEPGSSVSFMAAAAHLIELGLNPVEKTGSSAPVAADEVGYAFSSDDVSTVQWVLSNKVSAGVIKNVVFSEFAEANPGALVALGQTEPITRDQLGLARPGMEATLEQAIVAALLDLSDSDSGLDVMTSSHTTGFRGISPEAEAEIARVREMYEVVHRR